VTIRIVVLASGSGSNFQAVLDGCASGIIDGSVVGLVTNRADAYAIDRAYGANVPVTVVVPQPNEARAQYDSRLADVVASHSPDWVVLAGWLRILRVEFLHRFPGQVVNLHPARPGELPGLHAIERAFDEFKAGQRTHTGVMVHLVPDEAVDAGPVLGTVGVEILPNDTVELLADRVHAAEHSLLVRVLSKLAASTPSTMVSSHLTPLATTPSSTPPISQEQL
jgi:phosphoribosylglycinamide formyltransferase 1